MTKHLEGAKLGIFIFLGTVLFVIAVFLVGNKESLFTKSITIRTYFDDVVGLRSGAAVRLSGLKVGVVKDVRLVEGGNGKVEVVMNIEKDLSNFIRLDSKASIETEGLIGSKIISISPGSPNLEVVKNGGVIKSREPLSITQIIIQTKGVIGYLKDLTFNLAQAVAKVNRGKGTLGKLINDDALYLQSVKILKSADTSLVVMTGRLSEITDFIVKTGAGVASIIANIDSSMADVKNIINQVKSGQGVLGALINDRGVYDSLQIVINNLVATTDFAQQGAASFAEDMEALKHNWLFKGYFEQRGYWQKTKYEKEIDDKINLLNKQANELGKRILELRDLEEKLNILKKNSKTRKDSVEKK